MHLCMYGWWMPEWMDRNCTKLNGRTLLRLRRKFPEQDGKLLPRVIDVGQGGRGIPQELQALATVFLGRVMRRDAWA